MQVSNPGDDVYSCKVQMGLCFVILFVNTFHNLHKLAVAIG